MRASVVSRVPGKPKSRPTSHALGGPSTSRGRDYQIYYAIYRALELIIGHFTAPHRAAGVGLEPRTVDPVTSEVSAWDILTEPETVVWEAKLTATKQDAIEWIQRVRDAEVASHLHFGLVYGQAKTPLVSGLARLRDVAVECAGDAAKFDALVSESDHLNTAKSNLGPASRAALQRLVFQSAPEGLLRNQIDDRARYLAGEHHQRLVTFLFQHFSEGAAERRYYKIPELIDVIRAQSIHITPPPGRLFADVPATERQGLIVLAACPAGLPVHALACLLQTDRSTLEERFAPFVAQKLIVEDSGILRFVGSPPEHVDGDRDLLVASLDGLLEWILANEVVDTAVIAVRSAVRLAELALWQRPGLALKFFQATEHVIKNLGDKHLLLQVSELCIHAANDPSGIDRELKAKAKVQAMLCGHSWVYQRTGRLAEAEVWAERSERLGEDIGWPRNTAFAKKCRGRLGRIVAEHTHGEQQRKSLLQESQRKLSNAITIFSALPDFGPVHRQVGDCYSLLGRSQLVAGDLAGATESLRQAYDILTPTAMKEYFDLLILTGDIEAAKGNTDAAERFYSEVIDSHHVKDRELSEICARAHRQRGELRTKTGHKVDGASDLHRAAETWRALDEHGLAAEAEWRRLQIEGRISSEILGMFSEVEPATVRVAAVTEYLDRLKSVKVLARRAMPTRSQVEQLAQAARKRVAEEHPDW
jgi:tetratricopeptide (TPR) repeat protein